MKIENKEVSIKLGNNTKTFKNLILNNYLDLFADSFLEFKNKDLPCCYINITKEIDQITEDSETMNFDTILEADFSNSIEILNDNSVVNKYYYKNVAVEERKLSEFVGQSIKALGFGDYDLKKQKYIIYAYLDVSKYNIVIQNDQEIIISRVDKITSDMSLYKNSSKIQCPIHLTRRGMLQIQGYDYTNIIPKLHSVGFGIVPYVLNQEYLVENLKIKKSGTGSILIDNFLQNYQKNELYPNPTLYPSPDLYPNPATYNLLIYKFKLYKETLLNPDTGEISYIDSGYFYTQYKKLDKYGEFKLSIKYERS